MKKNKSIRIAVVTCLVAVLSLALIGCVPAVDQTADQQSQNRAFMSNVNQVVDDLSEELSGFAEALSQEDLVSMRLQVDAAAKAIDDLEKIEAPEGLDDIKEGYIEGCGKLQESMDQYLTLYTEIADGSFDYATYETRLDDISKMYEGGIETLQETDQKATELE